jgi:type IX secretion system PorP/SprF family membrane protein
MSYTTKNILSLVLLSLSLIAHTQDIHFSQFYAAPVSLNPAMTGLMNGNYRATAIYRDQWRSVSTPYVTIGGAFDINLFKGTWKNDYIGLGLNFTDDFAGSSSFTSMQMMFSLAYHKGLMEGHQLSLGFQAGMAQKSINLAGLTFPNQINGSGTAYDPGLPNNEMIGNKLSYMDFEAGFMYIGRINDLLTIFQGGALHHITTPQETFMNSNNKLPMRITAHGGAKVLMGNNLTLAPHYIFLMQSNAIELNLGTALEFHLPDNASSDKFASLGTYFRWRDAIVIVAGFGYLNYRMGVSYDVNISSLNVASNYMGGFEVSLAYEGPLEKMIKPGRYECPRW